MGRVAPRDPPGWSFMVLPPFRMWGGSSMVILGTIPQGIVQLDMSDIALMPDFDVLPQETSDFNGTQNRTAASIPLCYDTSHGDETNRMYQMYHASIPQPQSMNHPIWKGEGNNWATNERRGLFVSGPQFVHQNFGQKLPTPSGRVRPS